LFDSCVVFFFQAEDGIRDKLVTGVQTCALPISPGLGRFDPASHSQNRPYPGGKFRGDDSERVALALDHLSGAAVAGEGIRERLRSEERRVGKECRSRWAAADVKQNHDVRTCTSS